MLEVRPPEGNITVPNLRPAELAVLRSLAVMQDRGQAWMTPAEIAGAACVDLRSAGGALRELRYRELAVGRRGRWTINHAGIPLLSEHDIAFLGAGR
ncbi:MAG TPA: hypothetical protein VMY78_09995 [Solirubrobacteraceae bacterium]|nr:hypothetical protein [Solirubrobacteraceae bacterium]